MVEPVGQTEKNRDPSKEGLTLVLIRNAFYRDNYRRALFALLVVFLINILLAVMIIEHYLNPPEPRYFATNSQYQLIKWHPLSDPVVTDNYVLQWVSDAVQQAFNLDFVHWRQQLQAASNNFTPSGWHWFLSAFKQSGDLDSLVKLQMVSAASVTGAPVIVNQAVLDGVYVWNITIPIMITYINAHKTIHQPLKVTVIVERVPVQDNPSLIAINQFLPIVQGQ
ncbi:MAG: type IV secretion protein IcmL [Gammaproteobacteria bacterium RIFCSPHIGHO2_12_FULL_40_19]|nr:MAG: type IV secretion protein IcmL [Gammaproteobacteria bacterium RIFCSPHIGHO2_12_FULL_40_19]